jgi:DNA-binding NarL/FixJ family response regulator
MSSSLVGMIASPSLTPERFSLTDRQRHVLYVYGTTGSYKQTAHELGIACTTVHVTLAEIRRRLGVATSVQAVLIVFGRVA